MRVKDKIGQYGEQVAVAYLQREGFVILARNWRCDIGEIDIVALDGATVVVCEVKTRSGFGFGSGLEAVTREKVARLRRLAVRWLTAAGRAGSPVRIDVVAVHRRNLPIAGPVAGPVPGPVAGPVPGPHIEHVRGAQ